MKIILIIIAAYTVITKSIKLLSWNNKHIILVLTYTSYILIIFALLIYC